MADNAPDRTDSTLRGWDRLDGAALECSECGALVFNDNEGYAWRVHERWHEHHDDVERTLTSVLTALGWVGDDGTVTIPAPSLNGREQADG